MNRFNRLVVAIVASFVLSFTMAHAAPTTASPSPAAKTTKAPAAKSQSQSGTISAWDAKANTFTLTSGAKSWKFKWVKGHFAQVGKPANGANAQVWYNGAAEPYTATKVQVAKSK